MTPPRHGAPDHVKLQRMSVRPAAGRRPVPAQHAPPHAPLFGPPTVRPPAGGADVASGLAGSAPRRTRRRARLPRWALVASWFVGGVLTLAVGFAVTAIVVGT